MFYGVEHATNKMSLPPREAWIEIKVANHIDKIAESLPSREAWIEIIIKTALFSSEEVASLAGSEGQNLWQFPGFSSASPAPLPLDKRGFVSLY